MRRHSLRHVLRGLRVPTHRVDAPGVLILPHDPAWDHERIEAERAELVEMALAAKREEAAARAAQEGADAFDALSVTLTEDEREAAAATHPYSRFVAGATRFQPDAPDQGPRGPATASQYLKPGASPTRFELRRISGRDRARVELVPDLISRFEGYVRLGVARVFDDEGALWEAGPAPHDKMPDDLLARLYDAEGGAAVNLIAVAAACKKFSDPLTEAEGKR